MMVKSSDKSSKNDGFMWLLIAFVLVLVGLYFYLLKINKDIKYYDTYQDRLERMLVLDQQIENIFLHAYRYIDFDQINTLSTSLEKDIQYLKNINISNSFASHIGAKFDKVEKLYRQKTEIVESFKRYNAAAVNSIYYLYDLQKTLDRRYIDNAYRRYMVQMIFFELTRSIIGINSDDNKLKNYLEQLKHYIGECPELGYFYNHSQEFIRDSKYIKQYMHENSKIKLSDSIVALLDDLRSHYRTNRDEHNIVTILFFILSFVILMVLVMNYIKMKRTMAALQSFRYAVENSDNSIIITDTHRHIEYVNETFEVKTGYTKDEILGADPSILKSGLVPHEVFDEMNQTLNAGNKWQGDLINKRKDGTLLYEKASIVPVFLNGELVKYMAIKLDVTDFIETQKELQQSAIVYDTIGDGIAITDTELKTISVNAAFRQMFGYTDEELLDKNITTVVAMKNVKIIRNKIKYALESDERWSGRVEMWTKSGELLPIWLTATQVKDDNGKLQNYIATYANLKKIIQMQERIEYLAYHDSLTGLPNRIFFENKIVDILDVAHIRGYQVAVLFLDLDRFKVINDTLGHDIGDGMLIELSGRISDILTRGELFARIGGDEFVVIVDDVHSKHDIEQLANMILSAVRDPIKVKDYSLYTTVSIGIAMYPDDALDGNEIIKYADSAMYHAKELGKDNYQFYTKDLSASIEMRLDLEQELLHALDRGEIELYYQPQYHLHTRHISGAEALLRWHNKKLGDVSPELFVPIIEETGLIVEMGYYVFEEACRQYLKWRSQGLEIDTIAINISSIQFKEENILEKLTSIMQTVGISPHNIEIEITERFIMEYSVTNMTILKDLRDMGCKISVDDFGTGYSSMSYLKSLSIDSIKIDKSFVDDLPYGGNDAEVSKAIIALSKSLGYEVIAEGIENEMQEAFLRDHGCDIGQGFYFARPMSSDAFIAFAKKHHF